MKRFLVLFALVALVAIPAAGQDGWRGVYPLELAGDSLEADAVGSLFAYPRVTCYHPWGMAGDDGECAYFEALASGYPATLELVDGALVVTLAGYTTARGRVLGLPPAGYAKPRTIEWSEDCGCYFAGELVGGRLRFEAWKYNADDGSLRWFAGWLQSTGSYGPWWERSKSGLWHEFEVAAPPEFVVAMPTGRRGAVKK